MPGTYMMLYINPHHVFPQMDGQVSQYGIARYFLTHGARSNRKLAYVSQSVSTDSFVYSCKTNEEPHCFCYNSIAASIFIFNRTNILLIYINYNRLIWRVPGYLLFESSHDGIWCMYFHLLMVSIISIIKVV